MKIICDRASLLEAVNVAAAVVPARSPSPAMSCLKLNAAKSGSVGTLAVLGTDGETSIELSITAVDIAQPGVVVVSADKLRQILQSVDPAEKTITLELDGDTCHIRAAKSKFKVFAFNAADFPAIPAFSPTTGVANARAQFIHSAGGLVRLINRTMFATAKETSRYAINGVLLKRDGKKLEMVATDGRRLAVCRTAVKPGGAGDGPVSCIVPTRALGLILRLTGSDGEAPVRVAITDNRIFFAFDDAPVTDTKGKKGEDKPAAAALPPRAILSSTLVEGTFPPYEEVIPKDQDKKASAGREELASAVRQASVLTNEESRGIRLSFSAKDKKVKLSSRAPEMGESEIDLPLAGYDGEDLEISFNPQFITDVLRSLDEPEVIVEFKAPNKPGVLRVGADFTYVIMPVNLPG